VNIQADNKKMIIVRHFGGSNEAVKIKGF